jgi:hypothetical protein
MSTAWAQHGHSLGRKGSDARRPQSSGHSRPSRGGSAQPWVSKQQPADACLWLSPGSGCGCLGN